MKHQDQMDVVLNLKINADHLASGGLFYPCSGNDVATPLAVFGEHVDDFWFVDRAYTKDQLERLLDRLSVDVVSCDSREIVGTTIKTASEYRLFIWNYVCRVPGIPRELTLHFCRGRGYDAFRSLFRIPDKNISIFFYRGDSGGEGGSGFFWLKSRLRHVLPHIEGDGLIVSDGSNARDQFRFPFMREMTGPQALSHVKPFQAYGTVITPVGHVKGRYKPSVVWQVRQKKKKF